MYERKRRAIDVAGNVVELVERLAEATGQEGTGAGELIGPDGARLIPEGHDFYRMPGGVLLKVVD